MWMKCRIVTNDKGVFVPHKVITFFEDGSNHRQSLEAKAIDTVIMDNVSFVCPTPLILRYQNNHQFQREPLFSCSIAKKLRDNVNVTLEPSYEASNTKGSPPLSVQGTTIYHNIPSNPEHHSEDSVPLAHPNDGDGYILAVSFPKDEKSKPWVRGRFIRTKPFFVESRMRKRIYRGAYGTPGTTGWNAPLKPKASCSAGITAWGDVQKARLIAHGSRALPMGVDGITLVSRGPTALGTVLTDSDELSKDRATELAASPIVYGDRTIITGISRATTGNVIGAFITELNQDGKIVARFPKVSLPSKCQIVDVLVSQNYVILMLWCMKENSPNMLSTIFGSGKSKQTIAPRVDASYGTSFITVPRDGSACGLSTIDGFLSSKILGIVEDQNSLRLLLSEIIVSEKESSGIPMNVISDVRSGVYWNTDNKTSAAQISGTCCCELSMNLSQRSDKVEIEIASTDRAKDQNLNIIDIAKKLKQDTQSTEFLTVYDRSSSKMGIASLDLASKNLQLKWTSTLEDEVLTGPLLSSDGMYLSVLKLPASTDDSESVKVLVFQTEGMEQGPIYEVELGMDNFGKLGPSQGGTWSPYSMDWDTDGSKPMKSSYEIFDSKRWNDIESGFSSLGLG